VEGAEKSSGTSVVRFVSGEWSLDDGATYVEGFNAAGGANLTDYARTVLK